MRALALGFAILISGGCSNAQDEERPPLPTPMLEAIHSELGEKADGVVISTQKAVNQTGVLCGIAGATGSGDSRLFVFNVRTGTAHVAPKASDNVLAAIAFSEIHNRCDHD